VQPVAYKRIQIVLVREFVAQQTNSVTKRKTLICKKIINYVFGSAAIAVSKVELKHLSLHKPVSSEALTNQLINKTTFAFQKKIITIINRN